LEAELCSELPQDGRVSGRTSFSKHYSKISVYRYMSPAVSCPERDRYLKQYHDAVRAYRIAVISLEPDLTPNTFEVAYKRAEDARTLFERTRQQLKEPMDAHGCDPNLNEP
jgi:hypothetical protein